MSVRRLAALVVSGSSVLATPPLKPTSAIWWGLRSLSPGPPAKASMKPVAAAWAFSILLTTSSMLPLWSKTRAMSTGRHSPGWGAMVAVMVGVVVGVAVAAVVTVGVTV